MSESRHSPSAPEWRLRYRLDRADVAAFERLPGELLGAEKLWVLGPIFACGAAVGMFQDALAPLLPWNPQTQIGQLLSVMTAIAAGYALGAMLLTGRTQRRIAKAHVPAGVVALDAFTDRVHVESEGDARRLAWSDLHVISTGTHVFLCPSPREAIIIPLRAFETPEEMRRFAGLAEAASHAHETVGAAEATAKRDEENAA
jgi:hypothetical protein